MRGLTGSPIWGQGCGYFSDDDGGLGNITILTDTEAVVNGRKRQLKMTYGHMSSSTVSVGQRVDKGERIGRSGVGAGWPHIHLDVVVNAPELNNPQIWNYPGEYHLVDPIPTIIGAMAGTIAEEWAEPVNIPQPGEFDVPVPPMRMLMGLRRGSGPTLTRAQIRKPLVKDEDFEVVYQALGNDGRIYWVTKNRTRHAQHLAEFFLADAPAGGERTVSDRLDQALISALDQRRLRVREAATEHHPRIRNSELRPARPYCQPDAAAYDSARPRHRRCSCDRMTRVPYFVERKIGKSCRRRASKMIDVSMRVTPGRLVNRSRARSFKCCVSRTTTCTTRS